MGVSHQHAMGSVEYYTEAKYVEAARQVMGSIDTDPATCAEANEWIGASRIYTAEQCGLQNWPNWAGNVWLNPPGGLLKWSEEKQQWVKAEHISEAGATSSQSIWWKLLSHLWLTGRIRSACFVSFNLEILRWSQATPLPVQAVPRCYPRVRMRFRKPGTNKTSPAHPNLIAYLPPLEPTPWDNTPSFADANFHRFEAAYSAHGLCEPQAPNVPLPWQP